MYTLLLLVTCILKCKLCIAYSSDSTLNCHSFVFHLGEYSCLKADFHLQRSLGYHMVQTYLPTTLIVVISWVSFWLDVDAIPARVTLGVTTLLTISSKGAGIQGNLPPVSYIKAMDVWIGSCTSFVFAALLEFTFVNYLWRRLPNKFLCSQVLYI